MSDRVAVDELRKFSNEVLTAAGMDADEAHVVTENLLDTSLRGIDSHGIIRVAVYASRVIEGGIKSPAPIEVVQDNGAGTVLLDAGGAAGQVAGTRAMDLAIERAQTEGHGVAFVGVRNSNHAGAMGTYTYRAAERDCIGISMTNASPRMAPIGGVEPILGNNPWSIGVPTADFPVVLDIANSTAAGGKLRLEKLRKAAESGEALPTGQTVTGKRDLLEPMAGHKGIGISFMVDLLAGVLTGAAYGDQVSGQNKLDTVMNEGHVFIAVDIASLTDVAVFKAAAGAYIERIRNSERAEGVDRLYVPGEPETDTSADRAANGVPMDPVIRGELRGVADKVGVSLPSWL